MPDHPRIPTATYRLQFNKNFTFNDARKIVPYLHALGISDVYASPYFQARADSLHGYDITDHNKLNAAIGSREEYDAFVAELHAHGMGQILDFVPNHMGIVEPANLWWQDVLENGPSSLHAPYFDIEWRPLKTDLHDKILLPVLGDQYGAVLERGELKVQFASGVFTLHYFEHVFPIAPGTYRIVLEVALANLDAFRDEDFYPEFQSIITALDYLPRRNETDPQKIQERAREKEIIKRRLERRCLEAPPVQRAIDQAVSQINGIPGDAHSFDKLDELLNAQSYRLAFWRVAAEEINYRRFFDVNDLAAIRMELPEVFDAAHQLLLELVANGSVTGLRIDHPDGLFLPFDYFKKLQARCADALKLSMPQDGRAIYMLGEKILTGSETLRADWAVHGTTGYDFGRDLAEMLVDESAEAAMTNAYKRFIGHSVHFGHLVYAKKRLVMRIALANEVNVLGNAVDRLSERTRRFRDFTLEALSRAVRETIACFPVYRTYLSPGVPVADEDRHVIERAIVAAKRRNPAVEESVFNFLRDLLLFQFPEDLTGDEHDAHVSFVLKFQQFTGPIMAKGLEDTAFYLYNRLAGLNEVGGEPQHFGIGVSGFHERNSARGRDWPATLLATSTHDTKRSEDVRARMLAISEIPEVWRRSLGRWRVANRKWKQRLDDAEAPDLNEEYLLYQTLLGTWPLDDAGKAVTTLSEDYVARIRAYMAKALNEAKQNTSWIQPNEQWDGAMSDFVTRILEPGSRNKFITTFTPVVEEIARLGAMNSLTQTLLKLTSPGVPDIYQGTEIWDDSLVDPDNRRTVNYVHRSQWLGSLEGISPADLLRTWTDGRIKLWLIRTLLKLRRERSAFFQRADYVPLSANGTHSNSCIAFSREFAGTRMFVIGTRLSSRLGSPAVGDAWKDTTLVATEAPARMRDVFTGRDLPSNSGTLILSDVLKDLPFAVLVTD